MQSKLLFCASLLSFGALEAAENRPNIIWVMIEDWSTDLSCYGTKGIHTPNIDKLASEGVLYNNAYTTAPVSSTSRSAMMTGYYQNFIDANQHRLSKNQKQPLRSDVIPIPHLLRDAGYHTHLMSWKTDCNYIPFAPTDLFEEFSKWDEWDKKEPFFEGKRKDGKPLFGRITFTATHRKWNRDPIRPISTEDVELPPYYVDNEFCRRDWANGLEQMQIVDRQIGEFLDYIDEQGMRDNTIVIFLADNGRCHFRGKQFLYEPGTKVPMIVRWPGKIEEGTVNNDLVSSLDICKTIVDIAGTETQIPLHGVNLLNGETAKREYIFTSRDKMDDTHDAMRAVRAKDGFKLIHNLMPERAYLQYNRYKEGGYPMLAEMNYLYLKGELNEVQSLFFADSKPEFELYDLNEDPYEIHNLANDPKFRAKRDELLEVLNNWRKDVIQDKGVSEYFKAQGVYAENCPAGTVDDFVYANRKEYDYKKYGTPSWYPTRSLEEWKEARDKWVEWVFRDPSSTMARPEIVH